MRMVEGNGGVMGTEGEGHSLFCVKRSIIRLYYPRKLFTSLEVTSC